MKAPLVSYTSPADFETALRTVVPNSKIDAELLNRLWQMRLPPIISVEAFGLLLGVSPKLLGAMATHPSRYYRAFEIPKRAGGKRLILAPKRYIKAVQRYILGAILERIEIPAVVNGFVPGRGVITNASPHVRAPYLLNVDIENFFGSVKSLSVALIFSGFGFPAPVVNVLTGICTFGGVLPQGAPTSPTLANVAFFEQDKHLVALSESNGTRYSRYADDLSFSSKMPITLEFLDRVRRIVTDGGFALNSQKIRFSRPGQAKYVTGMVINEKVHPNRVTRRTIRAIFHLASTSPERSSETRNILLGYAGFVKTYNPQLAQKYLAIARSFKS